MMKKQDLLIFKEVKFKGKTRKFAVFSGHSKDFLGTIKWKPSWRCYVFDDGITEFSLGCYEVMCDFLRYLKQERLISNSPQTKPEGEKMLSAYNVGKVKTPDIRNNPRRIQNCGHL